MATDNCVVRCPRTQRSYRMGVVPRGLRFPALSHWWAGLRRPAPLNEWPAEIYSLPCGRVVGCGTAEEAYLGCGGGLPLPAGGFDADQTSGATHSHVRTELHRLSVS